MCIRDRDSHTVGIIGAGVQGFYQALYACTARDIHTVYVYNHSSRDLTDYLGRLEKAIDKEGTKVVQCKTVEELAKKSDIISVSYTHLVFDLWSGVWICLCYEGRSSSGVCDRGSFWRVPDCDGAVHAGRLLDL